MKIATILKQPIVRAPPTFKTAAIIKRASATGRMHLPFKIQKFSRDEQIVTGQVYAPNCLDSHGHYMTASELKKVAHNFLIQNMQTQIDMMHDNRIVNACVVESYIARKGDPDYEEGSWVASTKIFDREIWQKVKRGDLNGYSFEILTFKDDIKVEINFSAWLYGFTDPDPNDGHRHAYMAQMDDEGQIIACKTSKAINAAGVEHDHDIVMSNVTKYTLKHRHRIHLEKN